MKSLSDDDRKSTVPTKSFSTWERLSCAVGRGFFVLRIDLTAFGDDESGLTVLTQNIPLAQLARHRARHGNQRAFDVT